MSDNLPPGDPPAQLEVLEGGLHDFLAEIITNARADLEQFDSLVVIGRIAGEDALSIFHTGVNTHETMGILLHAAAAMTPGAGVDE